MASFIFNSALADALTGGIDFSSDEFAVMLCTSSYVPDKDAHTRRDDVTDEVSGAGYAAGGASVSVAATTDPANDRIDVSLGEADWTSATITARWAVYYKVSGLGADFDPLVAAIDFGSDFSSTNGNFFLSESTLRIQN